MVKLTKAQKKAIGRITIDGYAHRLFEDSREQWCDAGGNIYNRRTIRSLYRKGILVSGNDAMLDGPPQTLVLS